MVGVEKQRSLRFIKRLLQKETVALDLWENDRGDLFLSAPTTEKDNLVYFATTPSNVISFFSNQLSLQQLFLQTCDKFITLQDDIALRVMYLPDTDISIAKGNSYYNELKEKI
jgi:hypothetical protein